MENTSDDQKEEIHAGDHLHIRGEYSLSNFHGASDVGSPPHTWRILLDGDFKIFNLGITSTYVENTFLISL